MIQHRNTLISDDLLEARFVCNLNKCKGVCCVEGDYGAPIEKTEVAFIKDNLEKILPYLSEEGKNTILRKGFFETDCDYELVTRCLPTGECVFAVWNNGMLSCGMEQSWKDGHSSFRKPISCHLYPVRTRNIGNMEALNYHQWEICKAACALGDELKVPVFRFVKDALIRKYGEDWYEELEAIYLAYTKQ